MNPTFTFHFHFFHIHIKVKLFLDALASLESKFRSLTQLGSQFFKILPLLVLVTLKLVLVTLIV